MAKLPDSLGSLMHHPALAEKVGDLGEYLRFGGTLPGDIREMAILITARSVNQSYEWVGARRFLAVEERLDLPLEPESGERGGLGAHGAANPAQLSASMNWRQRP
jgi:hypothetical protein